MLEYGYMFVGLLKGKKPIPINKQKEAVQEIKILKCIREVERF